MYGGVDLKKKKESAMSQTKQAYLGMAENSSEEWILTKDLNNLLELQSHLLYFLANIPLKSLLPFL